MVSVNDEGVPVYVKVKMAAAPVYGYVLPLYLGVPLFGVSEPSARIGYRGPFPIGMLLG